MVAPTVRGGSRLRLYLLAALGGTVFVASGAMLRPRPTQLTMTARVGDDTVVINQMRPTRLAAIVSDQYGRRLTADTLVHYQRVGGDSIDLASNGDLRCAQRGDAVVRATYGSLVRQFMLHCRPVASIETPTWIDLVIGDSTRDVSFVAHGPDGRPVTELRGALVVENSATVTLSGTSLRPRRAGFTMANVRVGDAATSIPIVVYRSVESFVEHGRRRGDAMAMHVRLDRGDTIVIPVPNGSLWVTYWSKDHQAAPPTIELVGEGNCTTGDGVRLRRMEDDKYAKYCYVGGGDRLMIAHGASGAARIEGTVALLIQW